MFESFNKFTGTINEAKAQYMIGDKEASREDVLSYMFSNPKKSLGNASTGKFPKWVQSNSTPDGDTITWSTIKKDMKTLEKEYGKGNVVVSGNTNGGDPVVEIYMKSQNESVVTEAISTAVRPFYKALNDSGNLKRYDGPKILGSRPGNTPTDELIGADKEDRILFGTKGDKFGIKSVRGINLPTKLLKLLGFVEGNSFTKGVESYGPKGDDMIYIDLNSMQELVAAFDSKTNYSVEESVVNEAKAITDRDIKVGNSFKIGSSTFKVIKIYKDPKFGNVVNTERYTNNKKAGEYTDTLKDFVDFLNEEDAVAESVVTEASNSNLKKGDKFKSTTNGEILFIIEPKGDGYDYRMSSDPRSKSHAPKDWFDMMIKTGKLVNESVVTEAKMSKIHKAAKQGSYPAVIVVVENGKVIHQEPVVSAEHAPAAFNVMQEKYPKALLHLEDNTGKRLFSESVITEKSFNKIQAEWSNLNAQWVKVTTMMMDLAAAYKEAEGKEKEDLLDELKVLTKSKKILSDKKDALEQDLDSSISDKNKDLELVIKESATNYMVDENLSRDVHRSVNAFIKKMADKYDIPLQHAVNNIMDVLRSQNYEGLSESNDVEELNERRIVIKRRYTENHPAITVGKSARIRNKMLEAIADGKLTKEEFNTILKEMSIDSKRWTTRNVKYFNLSEDGVSLSKYGRSVLKQTAVNEKFINETFTSFINEAGHEDDKGIVTGNDFNKLKGGMADGLTVDDIAKEHNVSSEVIDLAIKKGVKVEAEHTDDATLAYEIAKDHVFEDPKYYDKLEKIEGDK